MRAHLIVFSVLLFAPFYSLSSTTIPDNSDSDPNSIYQFSIGAAPTMETGEVVTTGEFKGLGLNAAIEQACIPFFDAIKNDIYGLYGTDFDASITSKNYTTDTTGSATGTCLYHKFATNTSGGNDSDLGWKSQQHTFTFEDKEMPKCPPDPLPNQPMNTETFLTYIGDAPHCFDPQELKDIDSCGDDFSSGQEILPVFNNTESRVCRIKSDGSWCGYIKNGDAYYPDFENSGCYDSASPDYDDSITPDIDPNDSDCQDIGGGVSACIEDPINVCNDNRCQESCGTVNGTFVCLSGDLDDDGIPDYQDPDRDGDGIPDINDLDKDNDGKDDPLDTKPVDPTVNVDMSGLEQRLDSTNTKLDDIKDFLHGPYTGVKAEDFDNTMVDDAFGSLNDTLNKSETDLGGRPFVSDDAQFMDTFIGNLPTANCVNPVIHDQQIDLCSKSQKINDFLYWICAALTIIGIFYQLNSSIRRKT